MALLGRKGPVQSIDERLRTTFRERQCILDSFTEPELGLVQSRARGGLARVEIPPDGVGVETMDTQQAWRRLEQAGYVRRGDPRPKEPIRDRVPATLRGDGSPVTLLGDYAIVHALRSHPGALVEVRVYDHAGRLDTESRLYLGAGPNVILQELAGNDGRRAFFLYRSEAGLYRLAEVCGIVPEGLETEPVTPSRMEVQVDDARQVWTQWVEVRSATPSGNDVTLTTLVVGNDADGLWVVEANEDPAMAIWTAPNALGERLASLLSLPEGSPSWLPRAGVDG